MKTRYYPAVPLATNYKTPAMYRHAWRSFMKLIYNKDRRIDEFRACNKDLDPESFRRQLRRLAIGRARIIRSYVRHAQITRVRFAELYNQFLFEVETGKC